jgi:YCII-related domain-containing protein
LSDLRNSPTTMYRNNLFLKPVERECDENESCFSFCTFGLRSGIRRRILPQGLAPTTSATTVRVRNGKTLTTDGPFAETKEQLGGIYFVEAKDLNDAIQVAAKLPSAQWGSIEVRPSWGYSA